MGQLRRLGLNGNSNGQYFGTVRVRAGYAVDRMLFYVTGGLAYGGLNSTALYDSTSSAGYTIGAGVEYAFTNNWTAKVEALYINLDSGTKTGGHPRQRQRLSVLRQERQWRWRRSPRHQLQVLVRPRRTPERAGFGPPFSFVPSSPRVPGGNRRGSAAGHEPGREGAQHDGGEARDEPRLRPATRRPSAAPAAIQPAPAKTIAPASPAR